MMQKLHFHVKCLFKEKSVPFHIAYHINNYFKVSQVQNTAYRSVKQTVNVHLCVCVCFVFQQLSLQIYHIISKSSDYDFKGGSDSKQKLKSAQTHV